jgi:hypothetical protein
MIYYFVDLDGTMVDARNRMSRAGPEPEIANVRAYRKWLKTIQSKELLATDPPVIGMLEVVQGLAVQGDCKIVYLTSRDEVYRDVSRSWLKKFNIGEHPLIMRSPNDKRPSHLFKQAIIKSHLQIRDGFVVVIDDDQSGELEKVCKEERWTMLKAVSGGVP